MRYTCAAGVVLNGDREQDRQLSSSLALSSSANNRRSLGVEWIDQSARRGDHNPPTRLFHCTGAVVEHGNCLPGTVVRPRRNQGALCLVKCDAVAPSTPQ